MENITEKLADFTKEQLLTKIAELEDENNQLEMERMEYNFFFSKVVSDVNSLIADPMFKGVRNRRPGFKIVYCGDEVINP